MSPRPGSTRARPIRSPRLLTRLADDGMAILLVEHDVPLVMRLCRQIYVLNFGEVLADGLSDRHPERPGGSRRVPR